VKQRLLVEWRKLDRSILLQPSVAGVAVSVLVSGLTVDILSTFCSGVFVVRCVKLMLRIFFWNLGFYCSFYQVWAPHYAGEVEDVIIGRLAVAS